MREFAVRLFLLIMSEVIPIKSHQHETKHELHKDSALEIPKYIRHFFKDLTLAQRTTDN